MTSDESWFTHPASQVRTAFPQGCPIWQLCVHVNVVITWEDWLHRSFHPISIPLGRGCFGGGKTHTIGPLCVRCHIHTCTTVAWIGSHCQEAGWVCERGPGLTSPDGSGQLQQETWPLSESFLSAFQLRRSLTCSCPCWALRHATRTQHRDRNTAHDSQAYINHHIILYYYYTGQ